MAFEMTGLGAGKGVSRWRGLNQAFLALWAWFAARPVAWCVAAALLLFLRPDADLATLKGWLGDTDDAVRLVEVRELLGGASWFDMTLPRIGAPDALVSHWSRLIDAPIALLMLLFRPILGVAGAELAARMLWPVLLFFPLVLVLSREAMRRAGPWAAAYAIVLCVMSAAALVQFRPGRIDHHNAQILFAICGLLMLIRTLESERFGWISGALLGLGLAVGYEAIGLVVPALALAALVALWKDRGIGGVARALTAATGAMMLALMVTVPPWRWFDIHCDALSLNMPVLAGSCAVGLWAAQRVPARVRGWNLGAWGRIGAAGACAAAGAVLYGLMEPACLMGPFGQVNPAIKSIWLDAVMESKPIFAFGAGQTASILAFIVFVAAGVAAQYSIWRSEPTASNGLALALLVLAVLLGCWQVKLMLYAVWMAVLSLAVFAARLERVGSVTAPLTGLAMVALIGQSTLTMTFYGGEKMVRWLRGDTSAAAASPEVGKECSRLTNVARLGELPHSLIAANIDLGPYIVATTPHRVVAAPYHRLDKGILANHDILQGSPEVAERTARSLGVGYIALCVPKSETAEKSTPASAFDEPVSLRALLLQGEQVPFLQEVGPAPEKPIRVWRVLPPT